MPRIDLIELRYGQVTDWQATNPILMTGEPGVEIETGKMKIGNGTTPWNGLPYTATEGAAGPPGIVLQPGPPVATNILWGDTDEVATAGIPGPVGPPGAGLPAGGTAGQVVVKGSGTTTAWQSKAVFDVQDYGAVGNGTTNDTAAIQAALTAAGALAGPSAVDDQAEVHLVGGSRYLCIGLSIPARVTLVGHGARLTASAAGTMVTLAGAYAQVDNVQFVGMGGATAVEGVYVQTGGRSAVRKCSFDQLSGSAIRVRAPAAWIEDCFAQNCLLDDAALAVPTGVLDVNTTDCWIVNSEFTASQPAISASGNAYAVVLAGSMHSAHGVIAEISDHGWYISASNTRITNCRADLNRGHGWVFAANSSGDLVACDAVSNSRDTTNTWDGFNFANTSRWAVEACKASTTGNTHRYGFNDATSSGSVYNQFGPACGSVGHGTTAISVGNFAGSRVAAVDGPFLDMTAGATTWDVQIRGWPSTRWNLTSASPVNFTDFTNEVTGMRILVCGDGQTTFVHNTATIRMKAGANLLAAANTIYEFVSRNGVWFQTS